MTVRVTLDFESHDEALVFLARVSQTKVAAAKAPSKPVTGPSPEPTQPATPSTRKPRNDAGKARGPHKQGSEQVQPEQQQASPTAATGDSGHPQAPTPAAPVVEEPKPDPIPQTAPAPDEKDCQAAMTKVWEFAGKDQIATCRSLLERFGVKRIGEIAADQRAGFIAKCEGVLKGEPV